MITQGKYTLVNANEEVVKNMALSLMQESGACTCERCLLDVCALVLNQIHSHYVTSKQGKLFGDVLRTSRENKTELLVEITKAIERVKANPQH